MLLHDHRVEARRNGRPGEDAKCDLLRRAESRNRVACGDPAGNAKLPGSVARQIGAPDRVAVHGRIVEGRKVDWRKEVACHDAAGRFEQGNPFRAFDGSRDSHRLGCGNVDRHDAAVRAGLASVARDAGMKSGS